MEFKPTREQAIAIERQGHKEALWRAGYEDAANGNDSSELHRLSMIHSTDLRQEEIESYYRLGRDQYQIDRVEENVGAEIIPINEVPSEIREHAGLAVEALNAFIGGRSIPDVALHFHFEPGQAEIFLRNVTSEYGVQRLSGVIPPDVVALLDKEVSGYVDRESRRRFEENIKTPLLHRSARRTETATALPEGLNYDGNQADSVSGVNERYTKTGGAKAVTPSDALLEERKLLVKQWQEANENSAAAPLDAHQTLGGISKVDRSLNLPATDQAAAGQMRGEQEIAELRDRSRVIGEVAARPTGFSDAGVEGQAISLEMDARASANNLRADKPAEAALAEGLAENVEDVGFELEMKREELAMTAEHVAKNHSRSFQAAASKFAEGVRSGAAQIDMSQDYQVPDGMAAADARRLVAQTHQSVWAALSPLAAQAKQDLNIDVHSGVARIVPKIEINQQVKASQGFSV